MEVSDEEILESDAEFRESNLEPPGVELSEVDEADHNLEKAAGEQTSLHSVDVQHDDDEEPETAPLDESAQPKDHELAQSEQPTPEGPPVQPRAQMIEARGEEERPAASDLQYLDSLKQIGQASRQAKGGGKWKKRKRRNPFISFFLSMYSRRPRQRVAEVARQAGRHWGRMSDSQRKLYANPTHGSQP